MTTIVLRLDPRKLDNPDADIRYQLPDVLAARSGGSIKEDGYDYIDDAPYLVLFLQASQAEPALACVLDVIQNVRVLDNDLRPAVVIGVARDGGHDVVYPPGFVGPFLPA